MDIFAFRIGYFLLQSKHFALNVIMYDKYTYIL